MRRGIGAAIGAALLSASLIAGAQTQAAEGAVHPDIVEEVRYFQMGEFIAEYRVLVDANKVADPEKLVDEMTGVSAGDSGATAAYVLNNKKWPSTSIPVTVDYNTVNDTTNPPGAPVLLWAIGQWNAVSSATFQFKAGSFVTVMPDACDWGPDGQNVVAYVKNLPYGTLGSTCSLFKTQPSGMATLKEFDMGLDWWTLWSDSPTTPGYKHDLLSVVLHELGHAAGIGHSQSTDAVMWFDLGEGEQRRVLTADDQAALRAIYPASGGVTPSATSSATKTPSPTPTKAATTTVTPTKIATATPTRTPTVSPNGWAGARISLRQGENMIGGPMSQDVHPSDFLGCLPGTSWSAQYVWDHAEQSWRHYFNPALGVPDYVNTHEARGITTIRRYAGVVVLMREPVPSPAVRNAPGQSCP